MKTQNGFTLFEKTSEIGPWLKCKSGYYVNKKYMEFVRYV